MAKLIAVCRTDDYQFERRQISLFVDESLTMVVQFADKCIDCDHVNGMKCKKMERFVQRFGALTKDEVAVAMMVTSKDILSLLTHLVPCVGCRRSVERLFNQLVKSQHPALEPLIITKSSVMSINRNYLFDPRALYSLFYIHGAKLSSMVDSIPKSKKNKRCSLHSLENHKSKTTASWIDIWDLLSKECREEVLLVDADCLLETLETYLRKHRFCSECKAKVLRAYSILVGDVDSSKEKGYCPALYEGLRCCPQERHIHMLCETDFIAHLIGRAEPELSGSNGRRDRHAKTLDIAQEEVLTCLGIHTYERLHRIWQKLKAEEQTWQILFYLGVDALKQSFEMAMEKKQGVSNLELMCEKLQEEDRVKEQRQEKKRQKKKKKKAKSGQLVQMPEQKENGNMDGDKEDEGLEVGCDNCDKLPTCTMTKKVSQACTSACGAHHNCVDHNSNTTIASLESCRSCERTGRGSISPQRTGAAKSFSLRGFPASGDKMQHSNKPISVMGSRSSDNGYSSCGDGSCDCSMPSSNEGSDIACSEGMCTGSLDGDGDMPHICDPPGATRCPLLELVPHGHTCNIQPKGNKCEDYFAATCKGDCSNQGQYKMTFSLEDMLEFCSSEDEAVISEEDILRFKENESKMLRKRQELRETLRQRFNNMQTKHQSCSHGLPQ
ncbi:gametogenetin-binding protein 2-like isoform X2 [Dreissena polymorpha]|uniref:gametogenetin-binding protein 2-like isoform X2 n=1 Tax=Dreissena polymorpha TaxID=45954 RepID=UPI00226415EF|nr:gametogenetin-binding protein 2-like isoform X2 [Dreissena polymorpha]